MDISTCDESFKEIISHFDELNKIFNEINASLNKKSNWDGNVRDKCVNINTLISKYSKSIQLLCNDMQKSIKNLEKYANDFASNSYLVEKLKNG